MIAKNEIKLGTDRITNLRNMDADFKRMRSGEIDKIDFMKQYPNSQTTKKYNLKQIKLGKPIIKAHYEPYDLVLDYVLTEGHADTVEEAHYVMMQMDEETIQDIVERVILTEKPGDGYIGPKFLNIKNPINKMRNDYQLDKNLKRLSKTGDSPEARDMLNIPQDFKITPEIKTKYGFQ